jgi:uncharacterized protein (TIGR02301 family)
MDVIERVLRRALPHPHPASPSRGRSSWSVWGNLFRGTRSAPPPIRGRLGGGILALALLLATPALAVDPLYQRQMERLAEIMGSLYYLQPLCNAGDEDWRAQAAELIALDEPDEDRRQRLAGAFNTGYTAFSRFHRHCTPSSQEALARLLTEAQRLARDIHTRFAE